MVHLERAFLINLALAFSFLLSQTCQLLLGLVCCLFERLRGYLSLLCIILHLLVVTTLSLIDFPQVVYLRFQNGYITFPLGTRGLGLLTLHSHGQLVVVDLVLSCT